MRNETDLGKACRWGFKNEVRAGDENRMFGVPTIREDIKRRGIKSVADIQNYGDEPRAIELLNPQKFSSMGLSPADLQQLRHKDEVRDIFRCIGQDFQPAHFQLLISAAAPNQQNQVSLNAFLEAVYQYSNTR